MYYSCRFGKPSEFLVMIVIQNRSRGPEWLLFCMITSFHYHEFKATRSLDLLLAGGSAVRGGLMIQQRGHWAAKKGRARLGWMRLGSTSRFSQRVNFLLKVLSLIFCPHYIYFPIYRAFVAFCYCYTVQTSIPVKL
jgi:hypothetical protein